MALVVNADHNAQLAVVGEQTLAEVLTFGRAVDAIDAVSRHPLVDIAFPKADDAQ